MRKADRSHGYLLCFLLNLLFRLEWVALALLLAAGCHWLGLPWYLPVISLGIWVVVAWLVTQLVSFGAASAQASDAPRPNRNPYSAGARPAGGSPPAVRRPGDGPPPASPGA